MGGGYDQSLFVNGTHILLPNPCPIKGSFYKKDGEWVTWELEALQRLTNILQPFANQQKSIGLVDVGANMGSYSLLAKVFPTMSVLAYEPNPMVASICRSILQLNGVSDRVSLVQSAVGSSISELQLSIPKDLNQTGLATISTAPQRFHDYYSIIVPVVPLPYSTHPVFSKDVVVLKMDTEGSIGLSNF